MKKNTYVSLLLILLVKLSFSQNISKQKAEKYISLKGELTFSFKVNNPNEVEAFGKELSIVNFDPKTNTVTAWANEKQFRVFETKNLVYQVPKSENEVDASFIYDNSSYASKSSASKSSLANTLTFPVGNYPTYAQYAQQMQDFENNYPTLVDKISIGATTKNDGKELLFIKISDNVTLDEQEPKLLFTSSMHGDEIAGYPMMLSLINYILTVYADTGHADHARIKNLVENSEIWINPSANPDGTYYNSPTNTSVVSARRGNHNNIDLNRNYPDNIAGAHYDGNAYQTETLAFMNLANNNHFVIAANFHGGTELFNYPFDNAYVSQYTHPDGNWYEYIGVEYATSAQNDSDPFGDTTYMTVDDDSNVYPSPGVTHGAEWYRVFGGRQDYMNFYKQCKEVTIELSDQKILAESQLVNYWLYNKNALLDFLTQGTYGFRGVVKDATTGNPINATVKIVGHDNYGSHTFTDISNGDYYRPIKAGTYNIIYESDCYQSYTLANQTISDGQIKVLSDVFLTSAISAAPNNLAASNVMATTATINWAPVTGASYNYRYRVVGAPSWTTVSTSNSTVNLTGLTQTTQYEVQVRSTCNSNNSPYSASVLFTTTTPPPCSGAIIASYPYSESFEGSGSGGIGSWTQNTTDDFNWSVNSGGTASPNTGPSGATNGTYYMYIEANDASTGQQAILTSPCFDLNGKSSAALSFSYSMYGSNTGTLSLEYSINNGASWNSLWTMTGDKGTSWFNVTSVNLTPYVNYYLKLRFIGIRGDGFKSDTAIDNFALTSTPDGTLDVETLNIENSHIAPNPFHNQIAITIPQSIVDNEFNIHVMDLNGRLVYSNTHFSINGKISVSGLLQLAKAPYLMKITNTKTGYSTVKKIIKH